MEFFGWMASPEAWVALLALTAVEVVLGIDNIIFLSILVAKLPAAQREKARRIGLGLAMGMRILLLLSLTWLLGFSEPLFALLGYEISGRDLILMAGGLFLIAKSTLEIHAGLEGEQGVSSARVVVSFAAVIVQVVLLDIVFSIDSVLTAVGMANDIPVMIIAIVVAVGIMLVAASAIHDFIERHPTIKMLALSFLVLVGVALIGEGLDMHIPRGYVYFAMAFSVAVEMINIRVRGRAAQPVQLRRAYVDDGGPDV
ncbi:TerC family protein [Immundisolibacter sp.]|uniref:TerC family protein n=1 Tax=Immundisolibacter sp. TaxID=1934948 RepID=UPI003569E292